MNELSLAEANKLPLWLRQLFQMGRIIMWNDDSAVCFNSVPFKDWVENEGWDEIKDKQKVRWLTSRVSTLKDHVWLTGALEWLQVQATKLAVGAPLKIVPEATMVLFVLGELAVLYLRVVAAASGVVKCSTMVTNQVGFMTASKETLLLLAKEGEESFEGNSVVTTILTTEGEKPAEYAPTTAQKREAEVAVAVPAPPPAPRRLKHPDWTCGKCAGKGHKDASCPPVKGNGTCNRCQGKGHFSRECTSELE